MLRRQSTSRPLLRRSCVPLVLITGCVRDIEIVLPPIGNAESALFVSWGPATKRVFASNVEQERIMVPPFVRADDTDKYYLVLAPCPLDIYGFEPELWHDVSDQVDGGIGIPTRRRILELDFDGDSGWFEPDMIPSDVLSLRLPGKDIESCPELESRSFPMPGVRGDDKRPLEFGRTFAVERSNGSVLMGLRDGRFFEFNGIAVTPLVQLSTTTPSHAGFRAPNGEIWLMNSAGELAHGDVESGFIPGPRLALEPERRGIWLDGGGDPFELVVVAGDTLARFDGARWISKVVPDSCQRPGSLRDSIESVRWTDPRECVAVGSKFVQAVALQGEDVLCMPPIPDGNAEDWLQLVERLPGLDLAYVTRLGRVYRWIEGAWSVPENTHLLRVTAAQPFDDGLLIGGRSVQVVQYHPGRPSCFEIYGTSLEDVLLILRLSSGQMLILLMPHENEEARIVILSRVRPRPACLDKALP